MDASVKDSPGLCRCCFSEGCYKDLSTAYAWMGDTEIYADMLLECFDISVSILIMKYFVVFRSKKLLKGFH